MRAKLFRKNKQWKALPKSEQERLSKLVEFETEAMAKGYKRIAGIDEAGRGPLAGPVVAAACILPEGCFFPGINDSKQLSSKAREDLYLQLISHPDIEYGLGVVDHNVIDTLNIFQATLQAMREAVQQLKQQPDYLLVDGMTLLFKKIPSERIVKGDCRSQSIAAASIIAKERRDQIMRDYHQKYPEYGFDRHKGYGTERHRKALAEYGPCPIHRRSFNLTGAIPV